MDRLTREAIDERLRILEGVSNTVYRCIEDLTRVRSALPAPPPNEDPSVQGNGRTSYSLSDSDANAGAPPISRAEEKKPERESVLGDSAESDGQA